MTLVHIVATCGRIGCYRMTGFVALSHLGAVLYGRQQWLVLADVWRGLVRELSRWKNS